MEGVGDDHAAPSDPDTDGAVLERSVGIVLRGLLVLAHSAEAGAFYGHLVPEFEVSPIDDLCLVLLTKAIRRARRRRQELRAGNPRVARRLTRDTVLLLWPR